ncbi:piezo-type mechanosensitive ion channel-like protein [Nicotiana attenuata]|uniref:Piezo-type mechanosensitive ion channel-like protein n=1 Tax=Nicotiana attenuata TaxID=49451 RepID=A0A1J6IM45_NICAT|nr:piezo-type mechanosensitive ion channel-like protein [Nicotiana attenuata]
MGSFLRGFVLPSLLLSAGLLNWSLISLVNLVSSLLLRFTAPKRGFRFKGRVLLWFVFLFSVLTVLLEVVFLIVSAILGAEWALADAWWMKLIGLMKLKSWRSPSVIYLLVLQLLAAGVTLFEIHGNRFRLAQLQDSHWEHLLSVLEQIGSCLRVSSCLFLPALQLIVGISNPSWLSLPFFICSCVGLVDLSLTSNFLGLFRWWKFLWLYAGFNICLLYFYQLPIAFPQMFYVVADYIGLYKISTNSGWQEICSGLSLLAFYYLVRSHLLQ